MLGYLREAFRGSAGIRFQRVQATKKCRILDVPEVQPLCVGGEGAPHPTSKIGPPSIEVLLLKSAAALDPERSLVDRLAGCHSCRAEDCVRLPQLYQENLQAFL